MMINKAKKQLASGALDKKFASLYGEECVSEARKRYTDAIESFEALYGGDRDISIFSVSGRSELSGNHTDHNNGRVIAASVDLDIVAVASPCSGSVIRIKSDGFDEDCVDFDAYSFPKSEKFATSASIIAGIVSGIKMQGGKVGGFDAYMTSNVPIGSGLSSSAAFENTVGTILNHLYNGGALDGVTIAKLSRFAENDFFGKPCGLMDQIACAVGGVVTIDFEDNDSPRVESLDCDITKAGYRLCIVNTGGSHADLTADYAAVPAEMKAVAAHFGKKTLRQLTKADVLNAIPSLRAKVGDRAIMRAIHFFDENERVAAQVEALRANDVDVFLAKVLESGRSSFCYLQNVFSPSSTAEQGISLALCLAEGCLKNKKAAWRVHGGGFAGTVQAFVHEADVEFFRSEMDAVFGEGACKILRIRNEGAERIV